MPLKDEPECRRVLTVSDTQTEPPERADYACHSRGDDQAEPDSEWESGHEETRWGHQAPRDDRQQLCRQCHTEGKRAATIHIHESASFSISRAKRLRRESAPGGAKCLIPWRACVTNRSL